MNTNIKNIKKYLLLLSIVVVLIGSFINMALAQYYQRADYGNISVTRKNQLGGYDYYDADGNVVGYSSKTFDGDYIYYNNDGNKIGALKLDKKKGSYTYYNADNLPTGTMRKTPTGEYRYKDKFEGGLKSVTPPPGEGIGFLPPASFSDGALSPQLEGQINSND